MHGLALTIDTGTSNTRIRAWRDACLIGGAEAPVGVRDTARTGSHDILRAGIRDAIWEALRTSDSNEGEVSLFLGSGMITSALGLHELPHIVAPARIDELAAGMRSALFADIVSSPIWFIPGVRHDAAPVSIDDASRMDMMRGEETEVIGLLARTGLSDPMVVLLPGSHAKFVEVQADGTITRCLTTLSGELLDLLVHQSVLASGLKQGWPATLDPAAVIAGARLSRSEGISRAAFTTRALELFSSTSETGRFSFLLGTVLVQDLMSCQAAWLRAKKLVVCGRPTLQAAYAAIARDVVGIETVMTPDQAMLDELAGHGALAIARRRGLL